MNGGLGVSIGSQMTQEEIEAYVKRMLSRLEINEPEVSPDDAAQLRTNIICQVIAVCGRPIAKAEQEQMAIMTENLKRQAGVNQRGPAPVVLREGAFGGQEES